MAQRIVLFKHLLLAICFFLISYPLLIDEGLGGKFIEAAFGTAILRAGIRATRKNHPTPRWAVVLMILMISVWTAEILIRDQPLIDLSRMCLLQVFLIRFIWLVGRDVFVTRRVNATERLLGAICVYLLIGLSFSDLYLIIDRLIPQAFVCSESLCPNPGAQIFREGLHIYFSLVVMTTIGFGDITPAKPMVAMIVGLEAVIGQMFVAIVISRLVAIHLKENPEDTVERVAPEERLKGPGPKP